MDYKDTLLMPKTEFPMRGNLGVREEEFQQRWHEINLYQNVLEKNKDNESFVLHDGPPFANGDIHTGHTLNKILKDFVVRYQTMQGKYARYIPGWDTHGLPIETALAKKGVKRKELSIVEYRKLCHAFALEQIKKQKVQFKRLGILGEWDTPYLTLNPSFEADQIRVFAKMVERGLIYKGLKPVYWSPTSESALAEAEIEYHDKVSNSIYVAFHLNAKDKTFKNTDLLIWTTTPWTLPANLAVSVHPRFEYAVVKVGKKQYLVLNSLVEKLAKLLGWTDYVILSLHKGKTLEGLSYQHPLYDKTCPVILGEHVTDEDGTGLVHTAPGHGEDDYRVGRTYGLEVYCPVNDQGILDETAGQFAGLFYETANDHIIDYLNKQKTLLKHDKFTHSYPHDWRTNKPVIFRATPQWFASIDKLKTELLDAVKKVEWQATWGEVRLSNMITNRDDWTISRQRAWGVPLPILYAEDQTPILEQKVFDKVIKIFEKEGSNAWFEHPATDFLPKGFSHPGSPNGEFRKETDIMDVWFDSGSSYHVLKRRGLSYPADLYLEGSDQYRGWFNSSLITGVATTGVSPYKKIVSHGFVLDGQGRKMSKSLGNFIDPLTIINQQGADLLRLWVATVDYEQDVRISNDTMVQIAEGYRKIRNTIRFMLGNIHDFNPETDYVGYSMRGQLNRVMTGKYNKLVEAVIDAYENYHFDKVYRLVVPFMINDLSAFYLDYTKDILYIEKQNDFERQSVQSTLFDIAYGLLRLLTPILPHTTSEAYQYMTYKPQLDVYLENMPKPGVIDPELLSSFETFEVVREHVLKQLEIARADKVIGKSLAAHVDLVVTKEQKQAIDHLDMQIHQVLIVSKVNLRVGKQLEASVKPATGHICARCWNVVDSVYENGLCPRCEKILGGQR